MNLSSVLTNGSWAGDNGIDMNSQNISNVNIINVFIIIRFSIQKKSIERYNVEKKLFCDDLTFKIFF